MATQGPIQHVVLIIKENHTFDNYFGTFPGANGATLAHSPNPPTQTPSNNHKAWLDRATTAIREQYLESDIPTYFAYGRQFTLCDNYLTDVASQSTPNHLMLIAADSPVIDNIPSSSSQTFNIPSLPASLDQAGLSWSNYGGYAFAYISGLAGKPELPSSQFATDASAGKLPSVSWVYGPSGLSEHPRDNVTQGMQWTVDQVTAIVKGGLWPQTAILITWDDWGGYYDHVNPPNVEQWTDGTQFRYGSRVGCLVLSPYAKGGYVSTAQHSHVSLVKFCETTFGLPSLNSRDAAADAMDDCFDFTQKPAPPPGSGMVSTPGTQPARVKVKPSGKGKLKRKSKQAPKSKAKRQKPKPRKPKGRSRRGSK